MPAKTMEAALGAWRDGERVLETLRPGMPEYDAVGDAIARLREVYAGLIQTEGLTDEVLSQSRNVIDEARLTIDTARSNSAAG